MADCLPPSVTSVLPLYNVEDSCKCKGVNLVLLYVKILLESWFSEAGRFSY